MTRRDWLFLTVPSLLLAQEKAKSSDLQGRIAQIIRAYEEQGNHRTGTKVDQISGDWLADEVRRSGLTLHENFSTSPASIQ